ncbi:MAG: Rrf2 family transcriptional regulator [Burkholderiales bacterium]|nr:Rrf2 family transcriptional regulator [Burkholderiales bacterium]
MLLNRFTDFGLRILMYLTQHERALPITVAEISAQFDVPHNHLVKVSNKLVKLGLVTAVRGRNGGLRLALPADEIKLGQVLHDLEGHEQLIDCAEPPCPLARACGLQAALNEGMQAFYAKMNQYTLADVTARKTGEMIIQLHRNIAALTQ